MLHFQLFGHKNLPGGYNDSRVIFYPLDNGRNLGKLANSNTRRESGFKRRMKTMFMNRTLQKLTVAFLLLLGGITAANGQSNFADFRIQVLDKSNKPLSGALVNLHKEGILVESDTTNSDGRAGWPT